MIPNRCVAARLFVEALRCENIGCAAVVACQIVGGEIGGDKVATDSQWLQQVLLDKLVGALASDSL